MPIKKGSFSTFMGSDHPQTCKACTRVILIGAQSYGFKKPDEIFSEIFCSEECRMIYLRKQGILIPRIGAA